MSCESGVHCLGRSDFKFYQLFFWIVFFDAGALMAALFLGVVWGTEADFLVLTAVVGLVFGIAKACKIFIGYCLKPKIKSFC